MKFKAPAEEFSGCTLQKSLQSHGEQSCKRKMQRGREVEEEGKHTSEKREDEMQRAGEGGQKRRIVATEQALTDPNPNPGPPTDGCDAPPSHGL